MKQKANSIGILALFLLVGFSFLVKSPSSLFGSAPGEWQWIKKSPVNSPCPRQGAALVYDSHSAVVILFGGFDYATGVFYDDTWVWNGENWTRLDLGIHPPGCGGIYNVHSMAYDIAREETILFTGVETWCLHYDGQSSFWERRYPPESPSPRWGQSLVYDSQKNVMILFGGDIGGGFDNHVWEWDGENWSQIPIDGPLPEPRNMQKICYMGDGKTLLYGGHNYTDYLNNTWVFDSSVQSWTCLCSSPAFSCPYCTIPEDRSYHFMAFNPEVRLAFVFGGYNYRNSPERYDDTWTWDGLNWTKLPISFDPYNRPSRRCNHSNAMVYDEARHEIVLFGGQIEPGLASSDETWVLKKAETSEKLYLKGITPGLFLDSQEPVNTVPKYKDASSLRRLIYKEIGAWPWTARPFDFSLESLGALSIWLGLVNSDDQGTNFDIRAEVLKNNEVVGWGEALDIQGITRNPNLAKNIFIEFSHFSPGTLIRETDTCRLRISTCVTARGGHSSAVGLRLYYDAITRKSQFEARY